MSSGAGLAYADRVQESTATSGTGAITLGGASTAYQSFATAFGSSPVGGSVDICYGIVDGSGNWEVGVGTYNGSGANTVTRVRVIASSNAGALASFSGSGQTIWVDFPSLAIADRGLTAAFAMHMVPQ